eukprot:364247-Chlamydomonas_euryale.AAC.29
MADYFAGSPAPALSLEWSGRVVSACSGVARRCLVGVAGATIASLAVSVAFLVSAVPFWGQLDRVGGQGAA